MREFTLNGILLAIPASQISGTLDLALVSGRYEHTEAGALTAHLLPADRLLDLGAGAGYLLSLAGKIVTRGQVTGVEAGPQMVPVARANLARNGVMGEVVWGAVVPDDHAGDHVGFLQRKAFWASALASSSSAPAPGRTVDVPALRFCDLIAQHRPTVLSVDIEGGEAALFDGPLPTHIRLVVMELHPQVYGGAGIKRIFDGLSASGLTYQPRASRGATVVFERVI